MLTQNSKKIIQARLYDIGVKIDVSYFDNYMIDPDNFTGCIAKVKAGYYPTMSSEVQYINITILSDCVSLNGLYINY